MRLIAWSFAGHYKKVIIWTTRFYSRSSKGVLGRSKKEGAQNRKQDVGRKDVGKPRAVWRDKAWRGNFGGELFVDMHLLCQKWEWDVFVQPDSRHAAWMDGKLTSWFPYTLPVSKRILHPVIQGHGSSFLSAHHATHAIGGSSSW